MQNKDEALGTQPIGKLMLSLALPAVAAQFINMLYNIVDRVYIGNIPGTGALALTGVGVTFPIICWSRPLPHSPEWAARRWLPSSWAPATVKVRKKFWATAFPCFWCCLLH